MRALGRSVWLLLLYVVVLTAIGSAIVLELHGIGGYYWDFTAHMLYAKALTENAFYGSVIGHYSATAIAYENRFYIEWFRAPLMSVLMAPFVALAHYGPLYYIIFELALLAVAAVYVADSFGLNRFLTLAMLITPYVVVYLTVLNGAEILSMILLLFGMGLVARGKWQAGVLLSLAGLAKYLSSIFILLLLLLPKKQKAKGLLSYLAVLAIWLLINFLVFGNPLESYIQSFSEAFVIYKVSASTIIAAIISSYSIIFEYLVPFAVVVALCAIALQFANKAKWSARLNGFSHGGKVLIGAFAISALAIAAVSVHASINNLPRWGYIIYGSSSLLLLAIFGALSKKQPISRYANFIVAIVVVAYLVLMAMELVNIPSHYPFATAGTRNSSIVDSVAKIDALGLANCSLISNAWVYLRYYGINAHYPDYFNATTKDYAAVVFSNVGISNDSVNTSGYRIGYSGEGYAIYYPKGFACR